MIPRRIYNVKKVWNKNPIDSKRIWESIRNRWGTMIACKGAGVVFARELNATKIAGSEIENTIVNGKRRRAVWRVGDRDRGVSGAVGKLCRVWRIKQLAVTA